MKALTVVFAVLVLGIFVAGASFASPETAPSLGGVSLDALGPHGTALMGRVDRPSQSILPRKVATQCGTLDQACSKVPFRPCCAAFRCVGKGSDGFCKAN